MDETIIFLTFWKITDRAMDFQRSMTLLGYQSSRYRFDENLRFFMISARRARNASTVRKEVFGQNQVSDCDTSAEIRTEKVTPPTSDYLKSSTQFYQKVRIVYSRILRLSERNKPEWHESIRPLHQMR
jgi:hypothetical protein